MKATVRDIDTLKSVQPLEFAAYLRANGWQEYEHVPERVSVWSLDNGSNGGYEILLPLRRDFRDFVSRIGEALQTLEVAEQRSQLEILQELGTASADIVRVRVNPSDAASGSILLDSGVDLFQRAREMMLAAACAAVEPRIQYQTRKFNKATEYLSKVRVGQTERGSYVVNLLSRVAPNLEATTPLPTDNVTTLFPTEPFDTTDPFERTVTKTLADALEATRTAAEYSAATGTIDYFNQAVAKGVSANLCEAIVGMSESGGGQGLEIGLRWAPARPARDNAPVNVSFSADTMPIIEEAARIFRKTPTQEGFEVEGYVVTLNRREVGGDGGGFVVVLSIIEGSTRLINIKLDAEDYESAILAHKNGIRVRCFGNLTKQGGQFVLANPRGFELDTE